MNNQSIKGIVKYSIKVYFDDETNQYVGFSPELDYAGMGDTIQEAAKNTEKAVELALKWCTEKGTIEEVLKEAGYILFEVNRENVWDHKPFVANFNGKVCV